MLPTLQLPSITMSQAEEHSINQSEWWKVYGEPAVKPGAVSVDELTAWYETKTPGRDFVVVDVRRSDCEVSVPSPGSLCPPRHIADSYRCDE